MFARNQSALWTELDGQFMLMNIENGAYFQAVGVGSVIWRLLEEPRSEEDIVNHLVERYQVERADCARDVAGFLTKLVGAKVVVEQHEEPSLTAPAARIG